MDLGFASNKTNTMRTEKYVPCLGLQLGSHNTIFEKTTSVNFERLVNAVHEDPACTKPYGPYYQVSDPAHVIKCQAMGTYHS